MIILKGPVALPTLPTMKRSANIFALVAVVLLAAASWGIYATRDDGSLAIPHSVRHAADRALSVDQASLQVACQGQQEGCC